MVGLGRSALAGRSTFASFGFQLQDSELQSQNGRLVLHAKTKKKKKRKEKKRKERIKET